MNMKKVSVDVWIQLIGMLGVLGGLVFVGLEMRQSQIIAVGAQQQARAELRAQVIIAPFEGNQSPSRKVHVLHQMEQTVPLEEYD